MKSHLVFAGFLLLVTFSPRAGEVVLGHWLASSASQSDGQLSLPSESAGPTLTVTDERITIEKDADAGQVLNFEGTQENGLESDVKMESADALRVTTKVMIPGGTSPGRIVGFSNVEIRYDGKNQRLHLIVWPVDGLDSGTPEISVRAPIGEWVTITADVHGHTMKLAVGEDFAEQEMQGTYAPKAALVYVGMGAGRPFHGQIAEVKISAVED